MDLFFENRESELSAATVSHYPKRSLTSSQAICHGLRSAVNGSYIRYGYIEEIRDALAAYWLTRRAVVAGENPYNSYGAGPLA